MARPGQTPEAPASDSDSQVKQHRADRFAFAYCVLFLRFNSCRCLSSDKSPLRRRGRARQTGDGGGSHGKPDAASVMDESTDSASAKRHRDSSGAQSRSPAARKRTRHKVAATEQTQPSRVSPRKNKGRMPGSEGTVRLDPS